MNTDATAAASAARPGTLLSLEAVVVAFGGLRALGGVDLLVERGDRLALLGPNGAGKTTLFNVIAGDIRPTAGRVVIKGIDCTELPARFRPRLGVARTYQKTRLFRGLAVEDNLYLAQTGRSGRHLALLRSGVDAEFRERARAMAETVWLADAVGTAAGDLSHGQQRQLEIGMALVTGPEFVMLDEPASGLSQGERERLVQTAPELGRRHHTVADRARHGCRPAGRPPGGGDERGTHRGQRDPRRDSGRPAGARHLPSGARPT